MTWPLFPEPPEVPAEQLASGSTRPRYEDIAQDGRLRLEGIWPPIGPILWGGDLPVTRAFTRLGARGVRSVLTRVVMWGGSEPISVRNLVSHELRHRFAHSADAAGNVDRILFETWLTSHAPRGFENDPGREASGQPVLAARAFGQHVFTRPTAAAGQHRVLELDDPELERVPEARGQWHDALELRALPEAAEPLEPAPRQDDAPIVFGLAHTDGNQHVNFLAYPRLVEDAALRRLSRLGLGACFLARYAEIGYRKPCFAGDRMSLVLQAFWIGEHLGVLAEFVPEGSDPSVKPHCTARVLLAR